MNEPSTLTSVTTTKARKPAQKWVRFWHLDPGEVFYLGRYPAEKMGLSSMRVFSQAVPVKVNIWPWTKVRSQRPVKESRVTDPKG